MRRPPEAAAPVTVLVIPEGGEVQVEIIFTIHGGAKASKSHVRQAFCAISEAAGGGSRRIR